jgi:Zn-finger protein
MTYTAWLTQHLTKQSALIAKLQRTKHNAWSIVEAFSYNTMREMEPEYCPLYATHAKCHELKTLNCFFCACPHFVFDDAGLETTPEGLTRMSLCKIDSKHAKTSIANGQIHLDCSCCTLPHTKAFIAAKLQKIDDKIEDFTLFYPLKIEAL